MQNSFSEWLENNNLTEVFTTNAGDTVYANKEKRFAVIKKAGEYTTRAFYFDDVIGFDTKDDEKLISNWIRGISGGTNRRSTSHSTSEVYMEIKLKDNSKIKLQIFKAKGKNIERDSQTHVNLFVYACQVSQSFYDLITKN